MRLSCDLMLPLLVYSSCTINFGSPEHAEMIMRALSVDKEV